MERWSEHRLTERSCDRCGSVREVRYVIDPEMAAGWPDEQHEPFAWCERCYDAACDEVERRSHVWVVVWTVPFEGEDVRSVWSTESAAVSEAERLQASALPGVFYEVRPFEVDAPSTDD